MRAGFPQRESQRAGQSLIWSATQVAASCLTTQRFARQPENKAVSQCTVEKSLVVQHASRSVGPAAILVCLLPLSPPRLRIPIYSSKSNFFSKCTVANNTIQDSWTS